MRIIYRIVYRDRIKVNYFLFLQKFPPPGRKVYPLLIAPKKIPRGETDFEFLFEIKSTQSGEVSRQAQKLLPSHYVYSSHITSLRNRLGLNWKLRRSSSDIYCRILFVFELEQELWDDILHLFLQLHASSFYSPNAFKYVPNWSTQP